MTETLITRSRPGDLRLHMQPDTNAGPNQVQELLANYRNRQMKLPKSRGRFDIDSFQDPGNAAFVKYNGDTLAPGRDNVPIIDPTSNLISAGGDVDRNTGVTGIPNLQQADITPNIVTPLDSRPTTTIEHRGRDANHNSSSAGRERPLSQTLLVPHSDPQLEKTKMIDDPGTWSGRKISHALLRAKMHDDTGNTRRLDPTVVKYEQGRLQNRSRLVQVRAQASGDAPSWRDQAVLRYVYTSATQRAYEEIDWDGMLPPKVLPPATTLEKRANPVSYRFNGHRRYAPAAQHWQNLGRLWDSSQPRDGFHTRGPIAFCSPNRRNDQIPGYGGFVGGIAERDHPQRVFLPSTVLWTTVPKYTDTACRPNIPGYTGCIQPNSNLPANANVPVPPPQTTARTHRYFPVAAERSPHGRTSRMSKMVTLVPPCNPFNKVDPSMRPVEQFS